MSTAAVLLGVALCACSAQHPDTSARFFPSRAPSLAVIITDGNAAADPQTAIGAQPAKGPIARPNPLLTPGEVAQTDTQTVCASPSHPRASIPFTEQTQVFTRYKLNATQTHHYALDYLVPLDLGGAATLNNIWPAPIRGNGFHEKEQLNHHLRVLVCRGTLTLAAAQHGIVRDWFAMWLAYSTQ